MKRIAYVIDLVLLIVLTGCAASSTQSQLTSIKNPMHNASTIIKVTNQQARIIKNTQHFSESAPKSAQ